VRLDDLAAGPGHRRGEGVNIQPPPPPPHRPVGEHAVRPLVPPGLTIAPRPPAWLRPPGPPPHPPTRHRRAQAPPAAPALGRTPPAASQLWPSRPAPTARPRGRGFPPSRSPRPSSLR